MSYDFRNRRAASDPKLVDMIKRGEGVGAILTSANLQGAKLQDANLAGADLRNANLRGANLAGADLRGAKLIGADFQGAILKYTTLYAYKFDGVDFRGVDLSTAAFRVRGKEILHTEKMIYDRWTKWPKRYISYTYLDTGGHVYKSLNRPK
jgi:uncharacterized protein YjbI with pentapeptide repeats